MGVSGVGKTTVGRRVAEHLGATFFEGDDYHPRANVARMAAGKPLTDAHRKPWIAHLAQAVNASPSDVAVVACSALSVPVRQWMRERMRGYLAWIHLTGSPDLIRQRLEARHDHFMPAGLLASQFAALDAPADAFILDVQHAPERLAETIVQAYERGELSG